MNLNDEEFCYVNEIIRGGYYEKKHVNYHYLCNGTD